MTQERNARGPLAAMLDDMRAAPWWRQRDEVMMVTTAEQTFTEAEALMNDYHLRYNRRLYDERMPEDMIRRNIERERMRAAEQIGLLDRIRWVMDRQRVVPEPPTNHFIVHPADADLITPELLQRARDYMARQTTAWWRDVAVPEPEPLRRQDPTARTTWRKP
jgi:hypothetical protein